jgi:hypothetical protein
MFDKLRVSHPMESTTVPVLGATFDRGSLGEAASRHAAALTTALHEDIDARHDAGTSPADMVLHLADVADLLEFIAKGFVAAAAEARACTEIEKDRALIIEPTWLVPALDGSAVLIGPDVKKTVTWNEEMLAPALARYAYTELAHELMTEFAPILLDGEEGDRMMRAVEAGVKTVIGQGRHSWRVTDLARVRAALANGDASEAMLIDRAKIEKSEVKDTVKVTRIAAKPLKA